MKEKKKRKKKQVQRQSRMIKPSEKTDFDKS